MINSKTRIYRSVQQAAVVIFLSLFNIFIMASQIANAQQSSSATTVRDGVLPMGQWLEFRQARYGSKPILLHLRTGYERAVLMPEPVRLRDQESSLPGSAVVIDGHVVGFYPTKTFKRQPIWFVGLETGNKYELLVRASPQGIRQPLEITR